MSEPDDWTRDFWVVCDYAATEVEQAVGALAAVTQAIAADVEAAVADWEQFWDELWFGFAFDEEDGFYDGLPADESWEPVVMAEKPSARHHSACIGCQHYHGYIYGNQLLVCGMHPYGWEGDSCPDWEGATDSPPSRRDG